MQLLAADLFSINDFFLPPSVQGLKSRCFYNRENAKKKRQTNAKVRIYPAGIYLFKVNNKNLRTRCVNCSKLTKKRHLSNLINIEKIYIDIDMVSLLLTFKRLHTFSLYFIVEFGGCCWLGLSAEIMQGQVQIMSY